MPNWCSNTLAVHGPADAVKKFIDDNKGIEVGPTFGLADGEYIITALSFERALPTPRNEDGTLVGDGIDIRSAEKLDNYWYSWRMNNWGTKWDAAEASLDIQDNEDGTSTAYYNFETAWSPPEAWLEEVAPNYTDLSIKLEYREEGVGFAGFLGFHKGSIVENHSYELHFHTNVDQYDQMYPN